MSGNKAWALRIIKIQGTKTYNLAIKQLKQVDKKKQKQYQYYTILIQY